MGRLHPTAETKAKDAEALKTSGGSESGLMIAKPKTRGTSTFPLVGSIVC